MSPLTKRRQDKLAVRSRIFYCLGADLNGPLDGLALSTGSPTATYHPAFVVSFKLRQVTGSRSTVDLIHHSRKTVAER